MDEDKLKTTVAELLAPRKGILAADESLKTIGRRFEALGIPPTHDNRKAYRKLLFTAPALDKHVSGCILFDETIRQRVGGKSMASLLAGRGIVPGIKVDRGTVAMPASPGETLTLGIEGLRERLQVYASEGARFTKWRGVFNMGGRHPTQACVDANACQLALFAALSQEAGLVPLVEPEVLMEGDHSLAQCGETLGLLLGTVFARLVRYGVLLEGLLLKTAMVLPGVGCAEPVSPAEVAEATLRCLRRSVPAAVPGIVFLSGGQDDLEATGRLDAICRTHAGPWSLSFSFGRALQDAALRTWAGRKGNVRRAQGALLHRASCNALALSGNYSLRAEQGLAGPKGKLKP